MKRSRLLSQQYSLNEALLDSTSSKKLDLFKKSTQISSDSCIQKVTEENQLFKGLSFKKLDSIDTNSSEQGGNVAESLEQIVLPANPIEEEKMRLKLCKNLDSDKKQKQIDPNTHLWTTKKTLKKVMTLRHLSDMEQEQAKKSIVKLSIIMSPKGK